MARSSIISPRRNGRRRGMTLIEIMVVITILGMIAGMVGIAVMNALEDAKREQACTQIHTIESGLDLYKLQFGDYPGTEEGIQALISSGKLKGNAVPKDPWGKEFVYVYPGVNNADSYDLYSYGGDGKPGGTEKGEDLTNYGSCVK